MSAPDLSKRLDDAALLNAIAYYAERSSLIRPVGSNRNQLNRLLRLYALDVARLLAKVPR
jgi:hypothetical protein